MIALARASVRYRLTTFTATFLSVLLGTILIGTFAAQLETSFDPMPSDSSEALLIMGAVIGGWGTLIVLFSVSSTLSVSVGQRAEEIAGLRVIGATPRQVRRLIRGEVALVAVAAASVGALVAWPAGRALFALLRAGGLVDDTVAFGGTVVSPLASALVVVVTALAAATITGRRTTSGPPTLALQDARAGSGRLPRWRVVVGLGLVGYGIAMGVVTVTVTAHSDDPYAAMSTSGSSSVLVAIGLATLSPALLRLGAALARPLATRSAAGWLAVNDSARRPQLMSGVLAPVIVLTATAAGTLVLVGIDHRTGGAAVSGSGEITLLNNLVTAMICLFAAVMVVNAYAAVSAGRRPERDRLRLLGATPRLLADTVVREALLTGVVGVVLGLVASLATIVPFSVARHEGIVPDGQLWLPPAVMLAAVVLTLVAARWTSAAPRPGVVGGSR